MLPYNLLHDSNGNQNIDLSTPVLESVFRGHMIQLLQWHEKKPAVHRQFMHRQFKDVMWVSDIILGIIWFIWFASGLGLGQVGEQTADDIISEVDWDNMEDSDEETPMRAA